MGKPGLRVNAVAPTYINTPLDAFVKAKPEMYGRGIDSTLTGRMCEADEVAAAVLVLTSPASSYDGKYLSPKPRT